MLPYWYMSKQILIVEDEADIREAIADAITDAGYDVHTATNGIEGLEKAKELHPDLLLVDLIMPKMDGNTMLRKLREDKWGKQARVVVLTAMDDVVNVASTHEHDIQDYIIKSHASLDEILNKVRLALHM